jgi:hypothetical protein
MSAANGLAGFLPRHEKGCATSSTSGIRRPRLSKVRVKENRATHLSPDWRCLLHTECLRKLHPRFTGPSFVCAIRNHALPGGMISAITPRKSE